MNVRAAEGCGIASLAAAEGDGTASLVVAEGRGIASLAAIGSLRDVRVPCHHLCQADCLANLVSFSNVRSPALCLELVLGMYVNLSIIAPPQDGPIVQRVERYVHFSRKRRFEYVVCEELI